MPTHFFPPAVFWQVPEYCVPHSIVPSSSLHVAFTSVPQYFPCVCPVHRVHAEPSGEHRCETSAHVPEKHSALKSPSASELLTTADAENTAITTAIRIT